MAKLSYVSTVRWVSIICSTLLFTFLASTVQAQLVDKVTTYQDENGWKLKVNGEDFYVKGFVWGYSPRGTNYTYNLWGESDEQIKKILDAEFTLLKEANVNAIRTFSTIPPKWVTYIYEQYDIMSLINPLFGRYGATINGVWVPNTNYQDESTRETLKAEFLEIVEKYKDVPGVLMFALGNESNYGLSWSSFEIENLPEGEQNTEKAKYLYSLFGETIDEAKKIAPDHLFTIVNGDIQYLDLIVEYGQNWDLLGVNSYRGISFEDPANNVSLWEDVKRKYNKPVVFMEFGSDAFNARDFVEDQESQAHYLKGQWQEMYRKSYGQGEQGNSLGGFVFEWRDEWWKYKQTENLDIHDRTASWANGGYLFDHVEGQNNMNEEWFGVARLGATNGQGISVSEPRMAYYVLRDIWSLDPYNASSYEINSAMNDMNLELYSVIGELERLKSSKDDGDKFAMTGGSFTGEYFVKGFEGDVSENGENGLVFTDGQMMNLDFAFQPTNNLTGEFTLNIQANVPESNFEFRYGDRGIPITVKTFDGDSVVTSAGSSESLEGRERIEIYDFNATYEADDFTLETFYHVPRYHWGDKGDFFGLLRETTDMEGQDIWNSKAPYGVEYRGKDSMKGLTVVFGPEIYWGANPKAMVKYDFVMSDINLTFIHSEDIAQRESSSSATEATNKQSRQTTLFAKKHLTEDIILEVGGLYSSGEKVGETYDRVEGNDIVVDKIEDKDTLGIKAKVSFDVFSSKAYMALNYAGLVADSGDTVTENGTELPYSNLGNKKEIEGGILIPLGDYTIYPRFLVRENIVDANPQIDPVTTGTTLSPGINARDFDSDPFAVLGNREAKSAEIILTYDPTFATYFYDWNADVTEDAPLAYNLGLTYTQYDTITDSDRFFFEEANTNASFGKGLDAEDVYLIKSKIYLNPGKSAKYIFDIQRGKQQSTGKPDEESVVFTSFQAKAVIDSKHIISASYKKDAFGPYDFYRQFNLTYPEQYTLEYTRLLDNNKSEKDSSSMGVKVFYRTLDELSPADEYEDGDNDHMFEIQTYFKYNF